MGKRKNRGRSSAEASKEGTPLRQESDDEDDDDSIADKKAKTSEEVCDELGLNNVELEYTDADFQILTSFNLFSRMMRSQVVAANPRLASTKLTSVLEAKWHEFEEAKEARKPSPPHRGGARSKPVIESSSEEEEANGQAEEKKQAVGASGEEMGDEDKDEEDEDEGELEKEEESEEEEEEDDSEEEVTPKRQPARKSFGSLRIKMPSFIPRKSGRDRKMVKYDGSDSDDDDEKKSRSARSARRRKRVSDEESEDSDFQASQKKRKSRSKGRSGAKDELSGDDSDVERRRRSGRKAKRRKKQEDSEEDSEGEVKKKRSSRPSKQHKKKDKLEASGPNTPNSSIGERAMDDGEEGVVWGDSSEGEETARDSTKKGSAKKGEKERIYIPGERKSERSRKSLQSTVSDQQFESMLLEEEETKEENKKKAKAEKDKEKKRKQREKDKAKKNVNVLSAKKGYWQKQADERAAREAEKAKKKEEGGEEKDSDKELDPEKVEEKPEQKDGEKVEDEDRKKDKDKDKEDDGNESDHFWYCEICKDGGDLMLCDTCPKSFHQECLKIDSIPDGDWSCPLCTGEGLPEQGDSDEEHETYCRICKDGGDVILCDFCPCVYHMNCLNPPMKAIPDGDWKCPRCVVAGKPLKAKVQKILFWRWTQPLSAEDELDHSHSPQKRALLARAASKDTPENDSKPEDLQEDLRPTKELFVKYRYHSYWDCEWISELACEVHESQLYTMQFKRKFDPDEPPALEDGSSYGRMRHKDKENKDPNKMEERFYRYGIKPEWLRIHRIITHDGKGRETRYLVKWQDLPYEECTWEESAEVPAPLEEDFRKHVDLYWTRRRDKIQKQKDVRRREKPKLAALKKKLETQPDYISSTGGTLHPYQLEGFNWLRFSYSQGTNTILADEMGLGKTIQSITFLYGLWKEGYTQGPFLVTAPLSTVPNWEREFEFWAPELYVVTYMGQQVNRSIIREREFCYKEGAFHSLSRPSRMKEGFKPKFDVILTSYEFPNIDAATLASIDWAMLVIDEAHRLKSNQSLFFRTLSQYKVNYKLLLTGTPLQNNLEELFNLMNFLEPGVFDDMTAFLDQFSDVAKEEQVKRLHDMLAPHMLRRLKQDVLTDIPDKCEFIVRIELSTLQKKFYKHILTKNYEALNVKGYSNQTSLINIMMDLRKCCNHPYLFPAAEQDAVLTHSGLYEGESLTKASGKLILLEKMLKKLKRDDHRVLIFSQMTRMLDILEDFLVAWDYKYERIDGSVTGGLRQESIDRFNCATSPQFVFLLSTKAGGLGINLATADTVIIYDMDWNPHNDIQAFSRAHRIGQKNQVMIYRFVTRKTVEEKMASVCKKKMMLTELVIHKGLAMGNQSMDATKKESLSKQEMNDILKYGAEDLFKDTEEGQVVYDDEAVEKLLDRSQQGEVHRETGLNDYLRSFQVATYQMKDDDAEEEVEEEEPEPSTSAAGAGGPGGEGAETEDRVYWQKVLGDSYADHLLQQQQEAEALLRTLGKGKRIRKQINYAEQQAALLEPEAAKPKRVVEEATYLSDYDPASNGDDTEPDSDTEYTVDEEGKKGKLKKGKQPKPVSTRPEPLPPLLAKVNGFYEVLGFNARQRRSFLDAVMRYGLPPDDPYNSQWRVRDLKGKHERVFKAYVALFMRHLCEPDGGENDKYYSDGVPKEGLSRQHTLTRIGMIALIKNKVAEFETVNGTESLTEFHLYRRYDSGSDKHSLVAVLPKSATATATESTATAAATAAQLEKEEKAPELMKMLCDKDAATGGSGKAPSTDEGKSSPAKESEKSGEGEKKTQDESSSAEKEPDGSSPSKKVEKSEGASGEEKIPDEGSPAKDEKEVSKEASGADKGKSVEEPVDDGSKGTAQSEKDDTEMETVEKSVVKEGSKEAEGEKETPEIEEKNDSIVESGDLDEKKKSENKEQEENAMDTSETKEKSDEQKKDEDMETEQQKNKETPKEGDEKSDSKTSEGDETSGKDKDSGEKEKEKDSGEKEKEKDSVDKEKDVADKDKETAVQEANEGESKGKEEDKGKEESKDAKTAVEEPKEKVEAKETGPQSLAKALVLKKPAVRRSYAEVAAELRKRFWIADGGFTELHALWQVEETGMEPSKEFFTWHRRHDFWLLAGVVTHGYRHWQDILSDERYEVLHFAFRNESDRHKKAAFLNRRFQLLEQALVVEEQLRKAVRKNEGPDALTSKDPNERLNELDAMASKLRKANKGHSPTDKKLHKTLNQVANLVGDIKSATYTNMPATLTKAPSGPGVKVVGGRPVQGARPPGTVQPGAGVVRLSGGAGHPGGLTVRPLVSPRPVGGPQLGPGVSATVSRIIPAGVSIIPSQTKPVTKPGDVICID